MSTEITISIDQVLPEAKGVFRLQGIPGHVEPSERVRRLYDEAEALFLDLAEPKGIMADISIDDFAALYPGEGKNEPDTPLELVFPNADRLALAAVTLGSRISEEIDRLMKEKGKSNGFALGYMLDAVASFCADKASGVAGEFFQRRLVSQENLPPSTRVLLYSPGYCGWHVTGQRKLFQYLKPGTIGINLNPSCLMIPLKSVSGVLTAGKSSIHQFQNNYPFCPQCKTKNCKQRMES